MSINVDQKKLLLEMIEQIILDENELETLKLLINDLNAGKIDSKHLKIAIIKSRASALKRIFDIFPFYHKRIVNQQEIDKFTSEISPGLIQELTEKNSFLEEIGIRIDKIVHSLKE